MDKSNLSHFSEGEFRERLKLTINRLSRTKTTKENPVAFLLGGQPAAGKNTLTAIVNGKLNNDVITIDNDLLKPLHPNFDSLVEEYGKDYVAHVTPFSNRMTEALIEHFSSLGYNLNIEGTLRTAETPIKTATILKDRGYEVNLYVMAVSKDLSYLGTLERYESMYKINPKTARSTDKAIHDKTVSILPDNLDKLFKSDYFTKISLFTREGTEVYSSTKTPSVSPKQVVYNAINQKIQTDVLINKIDEVINLAQQNHHQLPDLLNWRRELENPIGFSMKGVQRIDAEIKARHRDQAKDKKQDQSL